jgi:cytochrome b subunit of formate dehydrogenase
VLLITSFTTLAVTGLVQKYAASDWASTVLGWLGGIETSRLLHRYAATLLMLGAIYHLVAVAYRVVVRRVRLTMLPTLKDAVDAWQALLHNLGLRQHAPQMGRYTFEEKVEYWSLVWGTVVMIITGFMMWNPIATARWLPGQFIPAAKAAHGGEAVLAVMAIIIWHMYSVHVRRFNRSMWQGTLTEEEMLHEHPLELADLKAGVADRPVDPARLRQRQRVFLPVAGVTSLLLLAGVAWFVTFEETALETVPPAETVEVFVPQTPTPLPPTPTPPPVSALTWDEYVSTLFEQKCTVCHGEAGGLTLSSYSAALAGSRNGAVIVPGDAGSSPLIAVQAAGGHPGQLSEDELERVRQWIDLGAPEN